MNKGETLGIVLTVRRVRKPTQRTFPLLTSEVAALGRGRVAWHSLCLCCVPGTYMEQCLCDQGSDIRSHQPPSSPSPTEWKEMPHPSRPPRRGPWSHAVLSIPADAQPQPPLSCLASGLNPTLSSQPAPQRAAGVVLCSLWPDHYCPLLPAVSSSPSLSGGSVDPSTVSGALGGRSLHVCPGSCASGSPTPAGHFPSCQRPGAALPSDSSPGPPFLLLRPGCLPFPSLSL